MSTTNLFTPPPSEHNSPISHSEDSTSLTSQTDQLIRSFRASSPSFYIAPPRLPSVEREKYVGMEESSLTSKVTVPVDEVIGEWVEGGRKFYFARYQGGIAHKYPAVPFKIVHGDLLKDYLRKKAKGTLAAFDPTAHYIHPRSRVRITVSVRDQHATVNISSKNPTRLKVRGPGSETDEVPDSQLDGLDEESDDDESSSDDDDDYDEDGTPVTVRRSTRSNKRKIALPFSPKKARSQRVFRVNSDGDDESESEKDVSLRRSGRTRRGIRVNYDIDDYEDKSEEESDDDSYSGDSRQSESKGRKKKARGKDSRPAYGRFRDVADLDYDSDEESIPLRAHRGMCEKCHRAPAHKLLASLRKRPKGKGRRRKTEDEFEESGDEEQRLTALGGWVRCLKCPVSAHWRCLASTQRDEILKAARERDRAEWQSLQPQPELQGEDGQPITSNAEPAKRLGLDALQTTEFICGSCIKGGICMGCREVALKPDTGPQQMRAASVTDSSPNLVVAEDKDVKMLDVTEASKPSPDVGEGSSGHASTHELLFRCFTCKRLAHYGHLKPPDSEAGHDSISLARYYQHTTNWLCADCSSYTYPLDFILAWRPYPANSIEPPHPADEPPNYKAQLPREYLVKWQERSYRRTTWVPHMWLMSTNPAKLKNFLAGGTKVDLLTEAEADEMAVTADNDEPRTFVIGADDSRDSSVKPRSKTPTLPSDAAPDAERRIPRAWKRIDRVLDIVLWHPEKHKVNRKKNKKEKSKTKNIILSDEEGTTTDPEIRAELAAAFDLGEEPSERFTETIDEWETREGVRFSMDNIDRVVWAFIKWDDLGYDEATWDSPPRPQEFGYSAFEHALKSFIYSRTVQVHVLSKPQLEAFESRAPDEYRKRHMLKDGEQPNLGQKEGFKLMPFQVDGFNWLCNNWWNGQHCILADEMGLGKTVQIATFIGTIASEFQAYPALVVVPNSTITNWVREFERWAPRLRVVPFYGEAKARDVIKKFELSHDERKPNTTGAKFHVLVTTYETLLNPKDFTPVFKKQPRWEVLVVDEGQRLKSDSSLLFKKLNELNTFHRIIMTGTPLNNNMRELFNLMNFLDPVEWHDLEALAKEHEELDEELVKQLHKRLKPYFLRRIKSEVLQLPPKNEVIVPISMAPLQKEVYRSILSHNLDILKGLTRPTDSKLSGLPKAKINNIVMQLRKCLQHPYLYAQDIEPTGLSSQESHEKLIDASGKLRFLKSLLPKLKARGHRVLLFSQFVIALNVVEDFLTGEGEKYLRLDGHTKQSERQKDMDEFNRPNSDVFIYLLSTRAGGVGINLWSADTVIIFDPDFNPHQDLQAIARAHRYGQQKTCLVFKLMVKDSAEERIMQVGKKKLVLDHLIVQKMDDDDDSSNVQSILTYGAEALFQEEEGSRDIVYTDMDIEKLIEKTEKEGDQQEAPKEGGLSFSFAKIWAADKDTLEEVVDEVPDQGDSWAQTLQRITAEREKITIQEVTGRGGRRRAAAKVKQNLSYLDDTPDKNAKTKSRQSKSKSKSTASDSSAYGGTESADDSDSSSGVASKDLLSAPDEPEPNFKPETPQRKVKTSQKLAAERNSVALSSIQTSVDRNAADFCGLCEGRHGTRLGDCRMTDKSEDLVAYRHMLLLYADYEPMERRREAIYAIDVVLAQRGHTYLIKGQPLHLVAPRAAVKLDGQSANLPLPARSPPSYFPTTTSSGPVAGPFRQTFQPFFPYGKQPAPPTFNQRRMQQEIAQTQAAKNPTPTGPSKRSASPPHDPSSKKKARPSTSSPSCVVCGQYPHHLVKDCPIVAEGPKSIARQIKRLEDDPSMSGTVQVLCKMLNKQKKKDTEVAQAQAYHSDAIEISD